MIDRFQRVLGRVWAMQSGRSLADLQSSIRRLEEQQTRLEEQQTKVDAKVDAKLEGIAAALVHITNLHLELLEAEKESALERPPQDRAVDDDDR